MSTMRKELSLMGKSVACESKDCLDSWKQIALYLRREVRTVQRWEKREGLPTHRHRHHKGSTVYAYKEEIDFWLKSRERPRIVASMPYRSNEEGAGSFPQAMQIARQQFLTALKLCLDMLANDPNPEISHSTPAQIQKLCCVLVKTPERRNLLASVYDTAVRTPHATGKKPSLGIRGFEIAISFVFWLYSRSPWQVRKLIAARQPPRNVLGCIPNLSPQIYTVKMTGYLNGSMKSQTLA